MANRKFALITGSASGMGRIYAKKLAEKGYGLLLVDINGPGLEETAALVREATPDAEVVTFTTDLTTPDAAANVHKFASEQGLEVEILINNAGMLFLSTICDTPEAKLQKIMALHCITPLLLCHEFVPEMTARGNGYVLNISSMTSGMAWPVVGMYGNTKSFVKGYSKELRMECRGTGVSVTVASFGAVDTPLFGFDEHQRKAMTSTGVMISPEKAVDKALGAMFKRRKKITPGFINKLSTVGAPLLSDRFICSMCRRYASVLEGMQR